MKPSLDKSPEITLMLQQWSSAGGQEVLDSLLPHVYAELHAQAARYLRRENIGHTLQTTALIHETYLKLINQNVVNWQNRAHFFAIAATLMRRILVDHARTKHRAKRGGDDIRMTLETAAEMLIAKEKNIDLLALDEALERLEKNDRQQARIVELRYFSGLTLEETAEILQISRTTVATDWNMARAWLRRELTR